LAIKIFWSTGDNVGVVTIHGDIWTAAAWPVGWDVRHVVETGSTNTDVLADLDGGVAGDRRVLVTDHQTAGRGRLDRRWDAPPGTNLLVSIAIAPVPAVAVEATHRVGLAAITAVRAVRPDALVELKWPNDVLIDGAKAGGILAQRSPSVDAVVVGLGLNVGWAPDGAAMVGAEVATPAEILASLLAAYDSLPADVTGAYRDALGTLGRRVRVDLPADRVLHGVALDVDSAGRLIVRSDDGTAEAVDAGDVVHLRTD
jgi:BirA family biotin operon repressor/biotin-[acetyl-CoA-carboxylase] ligase